MYRPNLATRLAALALLVVPGCSTRSEHALRPSAAAAIVAPRGAAAGGTNQPPTVVITSPQPSPLVVPFLPPSVKITWEGHDPDGVFTQQPVQYRFRLFAAHNPDFPEIPDFIAFAAANPDSMAALYRPDFATWTAVTGDSTSAQFFNLVPNAQYLFVITAFDEAGAYDPVFSLSKNMLRFNVTLQNVPGPRITLYNNSFTYTYPTGGYSNDAAHTIPLEWPANQPLTLNWTAQPAQGAAMRWYRWSFGMTDLSDETPRINESSELYRWSVRSLATSATLGPVTPPAGRILSRLFYLEAEDTNGLRSLGIVNVTVRGQGAEPN